MRRLVSIEGKTYTLLGRSEKILNCPHHIWIGIRAFCKTFFSLGLAYLFNQKCRDDCKSFWAGKKIAILYCTDFFLKKIANDNHGNPNLSWGFKYNQIAADQGNATAQFNVGFMYIKGLAVVQSDTEAVKYFRLAFDQGVAKAQFNVGCMYNKGLGVVQSHTEAVKYYQSAADQGYANAQFNLGAMYKNGLGVVQSDTEAVKYFRLAAAQNFPQAQFQLGNISLIAKGS